MLPPFFTSSPFSSPRLKVHSKGATFPSDLQEGALDDFSMQGLAQVALNENFPARAVG
ncbi:MAG: hypothetical protein NWE93_08245 [Candidatus Bathyarchaeota archaeon]|nr:hypothetical protein [Candidatus Bathyarchaeota archaeon]